MINLLVLYFLLNFIIFIYIDKLIKYYNVYDLPDKKRKFHKIKTSTIGGGIFFINFVSYSILISATKNFDNLIIFENNFSFYCFILISTFFFILGYLDDRRNLSANLKLLLLITLIFFIILLDNDILLNNLNLSFTERKIKLGNFSFLFTLFCFIAFINAFNLFDGINCQIGSYTLFVSVILFISTNNNLIIFVLFFPLILFLILNYKNKLFLGNAGSYFLGFVLAYLFVKSYNNLNNLFADDIFLIMLFPGLDMIRLFIIRIKNKKNPFTPDRNHFHHLLLNKFDYKLTLIIIFTISIIPIVISKVFNFYVSFLIFLMIYFTILKKLNLKKL